MLLHNLELALLRREHEAVANQNWFPLISPKGACIYSTCMYANHNAFNPTCSVQHRTVSAN